MSSVLKNQILKPLSRFVKNLSPDKIKLSVFRGEGDLTNLELDEDALMELLDLPTWLCIRKVTCNKVAIKIQWTRLKSQPIVVFLDEVHVEVEALEEPRKPKAGNMPSYRLNEGKYGLIDRVLDGMKVIINSVRVYFKALTFRASICLDRLTVASRLPNWGDGDLKYTFVRDTSSDQILLFKEICWETTRLEADGLRDLQLTPVKLITNACRVRITLKKRLSDSAVLSSRVQFVLDELLWVLTVSQLEAAVIFMKSLKKSILRSVEQSKSRAAQASNVSNLKHRPSSLNHANDSRYQQHADSTARNLSNAARLFDVYDVPETSYHVTVGRLELHFCEENRPDLVLSNNCVRNGSIRVVFQRVAFEFYPFHLSSHGRGRWRGYEEPNLKRLAWLQETPTFAALERNRTSFGGSQSQLGSGARRHLMESAVLLRVSDFEMTCVSTMRKRQAEPFASSDKRLWHLSNDTNTITLCYTGYYRSDGSTDNVPLPDLYCQLNPFHLRLDFETLTWLNAFYLNVSKNLHDLAKKFQQSEWSDVIPRMGPAASPTSPAGASPPETYLKLFFRLEAVQPRIVIPAEYHVSGQPERPHSMQIQASTMIISNVNPDSAGLASALSSHGDALRFYPQQQADVPVQWEDFQAFQSTRIYPINLVLNQAPGGPAPSAPSPGAGVGAATPCLMCCVKCETVWAEYCGARTPRGTSRPQPFLEEFPLSLWFSVRLNANAEPSSTSSTSSSSINTSSPGGARPGAAPAPSASAGPEPGPSFALSVLADCGEAPLTVRMHHYQYLYLLRLSDSFLRLMDALTEDFSFVLGRAPPQHSVSFALHLLQTCVLFSLPALSETFTYSASSNQLMRQFMSAAGAAQGSDAAAPDSPLDGPDDLLAADNDLPPEEGHTLPAHGLNGVPPLLSDGPAPAAPAGVSFPPEVAPLPPLPPGQATPSSRSRSPAGQHRPGAPAPKSFALAFHRLGNSLNRFGDAVKATVSTSTPHSPAGTDEDGWERLSLGGSEFSDSDEEAKVARLMQQLEPQQLGAGHAQAPAAAPNTGSVTSVWDQQQQLAGSMTTAALDAAEAAGADEVDEEAEDVLELESVVSSSVVSASRRDHSTVTFVARRLHCYGGLAAAGSVLAGHLDAVEVRQSGARGRRAEAEAVAADEAAEAAEKEAGSATGEPAGAQAGGGRGGPLMHFRVDIAAASGLSSEASEPAPSSVWSRVRVLRPWALSMLMSSVANLGDLLEDEVEAPPMPFTCVLEGGLQLLLREDRLCNNLTCPGQHPELRLALPPGLWVERGRDLTLRLDVRQPLQMQARAAAAAVVEGGIRVRPPPSPAMSNSSAQTDTGDPTAGGSTGASPASAPVGSGHAPSQELLNLYYTENRKLREKMSRLSRSAAETAAALEEARMELHTMRQERESLYTTLDCLQAELLSAGPDQRRTGLTKR